MQGNANRRAYTNKPKPVNYSLDNKHVSHLVGTSWEPQHSNNYQCFYTMRDELKKRQVDQELFSLTRSSSHHLLDHRYFSLSMVA